MKTGINLEDNENFMRELRGHGLNDRSLAQKYGCDHSWVAKLRYKYDVDAVRQHQNGTHRGVIHSDDELLEAVFNYETLQEAAESIGYTENHVCLRLKKLGINLK